LVVADDGSEHVRSMEGVARLPGVEVRPDQVARADEPPVDVEDHQRKGRTWVRVARCRSPDAWWCANDVRRDNERRRRETLPTRVRECLRGHALGGDLTGAAGQREAEGENGSDSSNSHGTPPWEPR